MLSALTKLFVVLLIICSLLLTSATVIFVNRTEDFKNALDKSKTQILTLERDLQIAQIDRNAAQSREEKASADAIRTLTDLQGQLTQLKREIGNRDVTVNELKTKNAVQSAANTQQAAALAIAQKTLQDLTARYDGLIKEADKNRLANAQLVGANADLQKRVEEAERERKWIAEQLVQVKKDLADAKNLLAQNNIPLEVAGSKRIGTPNLKGVIKDVKVDGELAFATITLGSTDKVEKGMEFNVINQSTMEFLGKLTVESVEPNEAFGRLEGRRIKDVKPDYQVLSQLP
jgi:hypothetical protein